MFYKQTEDWEYNSILFSYPYQCLWHNSGKLVWPSLFGSSTSLEELLCLFFFACDWRSQIKTNTPSASKTIVLQWRSSVCNPRQPLFHHKFSFCTSHWRWQRWDQMKMNRISKWHFQHQVMQTKIYNYVSKLPGKSV